jgi:hypothetical protein
LFPLPFHTHIGALCHVGNASKSSTICREVVFLEEALEKMKFIEPGCEIVHAAHAVGATFGDSE